MRQTVLWMAAGVAVFIGSARAEAPAGRPLVPERLVFNWHNFLSGCSTWDFEDWQRWTAQSQKYGYNAIMVHAYGNNPMAGFTFQGRPKPVGYLSTTARGRDWSTMHVNDVRRLVGGEVFDGPVFGCAAGRVPDERRVEAAQALMGRVFADAAGRGMGVYFAVDVDTPSANPPELVELLPETARFKAGQGLWLPMPDTPEGYAYYRAQVEGLLKAYPQITRLVVWFRRGNTPWMALKATEFPEAWKKEYADEIARTPGYEKAWRSAGLFAIGKIVRAFEKARNELGASHTQIAAGTWGFEFLPAADRFLPAGVPLLGLDYDVIHGKPQLGSAEGRAALAAVGAHRPVIPVIWAHHDDAHYLGRPYTPFEDFASKLADARAAGFGVIHWTTRPLDLYFFSHARQVFAATRDEPLRTTCEVFAKQELNEPALGGYLYQWITEAPRFARETGDRLIDRPLTNCAAVAAGCRERLKLLDGAKGQHADFCRGWERFVAAFFETHDLFQQAQAAIADNATERARTLMAQCDPESVIRQYAAFSSIGGITRGEQGLVVSLNTRWLVYFTRLRQILGMEPVRYAFGPTSHDPLAQAPGRFTYFFDDAHRVWQRLGTKETGAETFEAPTAREEIGRQGLLIAKPLTLAVRPIVHPVSLPPGDYRLRLLLLDPDATAAGQHVFEVRVGTAGGEEEWTFEPVKAAYLRLRCRGTSENAWNSLHEVRLATLAQTGGGPRATASAAVKGFEAEKAVDGDLETRWAADGRDHWLRLRLDPQAVTDRIGLLWYRGDQRQADFSIETSADSERWTPVRNLRRAASGGMQVAEVDVFKEAGGANRLLERVFPVTLHRPGEVSVTLSPVKGRAVISGLILEGDQK
ncbi:MAG TPA: discoidin domain-containing protein [Kiritimatiellia bacterium]|nr:discoidin domain-containing protein [Kiritimatiellia bacterium]